MAILDNLRQWFGCSTPYGIKGIGTLGTPQTWLQSSDSAQRLTASKELEPLSNCILICLLVLNALRHQRNWNINNWIGKLTKL